MATEILINDGGAPARILPYLASEDISAGEFLSVDTNGKVQLAINSDFSSGFCGSGIGWSLTDSASGSICNVITGQGVIIRAQCNDLGGAGYSAMVGTTAGQMAVATAQGGSATFPIQAVSLEDLGAAGLWKVQTQ